MKHISIFEAFEHNKSDLMSFLSESLKELDKYKNKNKYLSISRDEKTILDDYTSGSTSQPKANYLIGYRWFEKNKTYLHVKPKLHGNKQADFMKMFLVCLKDPIVSKKLDKTYQIFFNEPMIEIRKEKDEITPFLILHFLQLVKNISKKGLKKGYVRVTENLTSKIKGKILINQTIKSNHLKNRLDKTVCNYQIFTTNCLENQIIKTALMRCGKFLHGIKDDSMIKTFRQNINYFELVDTKDVFDNDFNKIKHSPFYKDYKEALQLSQMIFKRFGFDLNKNSNDNNTTMIPPYYIDMPELFERYVEVKLRESEYKIIDGNNSGKVASWQMKPDFLLPKSENYEPLILDAKYKYWFDGGKNGSFNENSEYKDDYMQLSLYSRDLQVKKTLKVQIQDFSKEIDLIFIYPKFDGVEKINITSYNENNIEEVDENGLNISLNFNKIKRVGLFIPSRLV